jgi:biopolymer transport protein ExbD
MPLKTQIEEPPSLNLTAMLDVMFVLIIFFVLNTKFMDEEREIALHVPQVADRGVLGTTPERKTINVYRDGAITLDQSPVTLEDLTARLASARSQSPRLGVVVRGDGEGQFQLVAAVLNACKQAGIGDLGISVRLASAGTVQK